MYKRQDLTRRLDTHGNDEITRLGQHFNSFTGQLQQVVTRLRDAAHELDGSANAVGNSAEQARQRSEQQSQQMEQVATAINEVSYAVQDVAKNAEQASSEMSAAQDCARQGQQSIHGSLRKIDELSATIDQAVRVIEALASQSTRIGSVLEVILSLIHI
mgnify:FL=1